MNITRRTIAQGVLVFVVIVATSWPAQAQFTAAGVCGNPTANVDRALVYDIDFGGAPSGGTQILLQAARPAPAFPPLTTSSVPIQRLLETSLAIRHTVTVFFADGEQPSPISLTVLRDEEWKGEGRVKCMACEEAGTCAVVVGQKGTDVVLTTTNLRAQGILLTAVAHSIPVDPGTLQYDAERAITRVKLNDPVK